MGARSRRKGNAAELEVAKLIEAWWRALEPDCKFQRTPGSGGWLGAKGRDVRDAFGVGGDLCTTARLFPFQLEVKRREAWSVDNFLAGRRGPPWAWWEQCTTAATSAQRVPMLWLRRSRDPWLVVLPAGYLKTIPAVASMGPGGPEVFAARDVLSYRPRWLVPAAY